MTHTKLLPEIVQYLDNNKYQLSQIAKHLKLASGATISVQASDGHYCEPRENLPSFADYRTFEIGYPSVVFPELAPYDDGDVVYAQVPAEVINSIVQNNGGLAPECLPQQPTFEERVAIKWMEGLNDPQAEYNKRVSSTVVASDFNNLVVLAHWQSEYVAWRGIAKNWLLSANREKFQSVRKLQMKRSAYAHCIANHYHKLLVKAGC